MLIRIKGLFYLLTLVAVFPGSEETCYRIRRQIMIENEESSLGYISTMYKEIEQQQNQKMIRNGTGTLILDSLSRMSHGWCKPESKGEAVRQERSLALAIAALISLGTFILGPAIAALLHEITENTKWRKDATNYGIKTIEWMEDMEKKILASQKVEEILASIMLHESIMADLLTHSDRNSLNRTWRKVFKIMIDTYTQNGFSEASPEDINFEAEDNLLPREVYHYTVIVHTNDNCNNAKIKIKAVGIIPDTDCLKPHEDNPTTTTKGYMKLLTENENICIYTGNSTVTLADKSIFSLSNSLLGPCKNDFLNFNTHKNTLLLHPKHDRAYMRIGCEGSKVLKHVLYKDEMLVPPSKCSLWVSDTKRKKPDMARDFMEIKEEYINSEDGSEIQGNINMTRKSIIFLPFTALSDLDNKEKETKDYVSFIKSILDDRHQQEEKHQQGNKLINIAIGMTCTLALVILCLTGRKLKQQTQPVAHLTIWHTQGGDQQDGQKALEEKEETRELLERKHSEKEQGEPYSQRTRSSKELYLKESQLKLEDKNNDEKNRSKETAENPEEHYDVPRILYGREHNMHVYEYLDDIVLFKSESEKDTPSKTTMKKGTMEDKTPENNENNKIARNINKMGTVLQAHSSVTKENKSQLETEEAKYEEALEQGRTGVEEEISQEDEPTTPVQDQDSNNKRSEDLTQNHMAEEQKTQPEDKERDNEEKNMNKEEIYETMAAETRSQVEKKRNVTEKSQLEDICQGSTHDQMLKELHKRFLQMRHLHNL